MQDDHNKQIAAAAGSRLGPLGLRRKGRSRTWLGDHGWWLLAVEFQPSSFAKGSFLNVAPHWLWSPAALDDPNFYLSFDFGPVRLTPFVSLEGDDRESDIGRLVDTAVDAVGSLRAQLPSIEGAAPAIIAFDAKRQEGGWVAHWSAFHAGIAAGLTGKEDVARMKFESTLAQSAGNPSALYPASARMLALIGDREAFRDAVLEMVAKRRAAFKLREWDQPF